MDKRAIEQIASAPCELRLTEELLNAFDSFHNPIHESGIDLSATEVISPIRVRPRQNSVLADTSAGRSQ